MGGMRCALGVDIGGSFTKVGVVDTSGAVRCQESIPTASNSDPIPYFQTLRQSINNMSRQYQPVGVGIALPGFLSEDRQRITYNPNTPALAGYDFLRELRNLELPLAFEQDLNTPALAEYRFGERRGARRLLTAAMGTGLGAAVLLDGELVRIMGGTAGDNGHIILQPGGPSCTGGCQGCAEALVSTLAIERVFGEIASDPRVASIQQDIHAGVSIAQAVIQAAARGHPLAQEIIVELGRWLGQWLAGLAATFMPEVIILCGGVSEAGELLRRTADQRMRQLAGPEYTARTEVITGKFRGQAGMVGAAVPFL